MKTLLTLALLVGSCCAQSLGFGTVLAVEPNIGPGENAVYLRGLGVSFVLFGGAFDPVGHKKIINVANHFSFTRGVLTMDFTDKGICQNTCKFVGTFDPYKFSVLGVSEEHSVLIGHLTGTLDGRPAIATYSQTWSHVNGSQQMSGGGFSVVYTDVGQFFSDFSN